MLEIIETSYDRPIRMIAQPGRKFEPGMLVRSIQIEDGSTLCDVCEDTMQVLGVIGSKRHLKTLSYDVEDMVIVWAQRMIFRTNKYLAGTEFIPGGPLYAGKGGLFTSRRANENVPCVARITRVPGVGKKPWFEALWFLGVPLRVLVTEM